MAMQRTDRDRGTKGITSIVTLKVLGALTGHGREIATFDSYAIARNANRHRRETVGYVPTQEIASRRRERALTPPPFGRAVLHPSQLNEQTQSPLFKLPEEVLLLIYEEILGHNLFHIVRRSTRFQLGHVLCKANTPRRQEECNEHECRGMKVPSGVHPKTRPGNGGLIQLLQSCRRIYIDAVRILYSSNIFDFDCMETLISFSTTLVPARFDSIISLQLDFRFPLSVHFREATPQNDSDRWERTWRIIGSMKSLQFLYVRIAWPKSEMSVREERRFVEPLRQVKELKCFEVSLQPVIGTEFQKDKEQHWVVFRRMR